MSGSSGGGGGFGVCLASGFIRFILSPSLRPSLALRHRHKCDAHFARPHAASDKVAAGCQMEDSADATAINLHSAYPGALVQADIDGALEEHEVALRELERLELGAQRVALVVRLKVLEQVGVDGAPEKEMEIMRSSGFRGQKGSLL